MKNLYPLKFRPILKEKIWGGNKLKNLFNKPCGSMPNCGESWELSGVEGNISVVSNGSLVGNSLIELIDEYKGKLVGDKVFDSFGNKFPLLVKFIDANDDLSIQVHPDDSLAKIRHNSFGKTEMWYVIQSDENAGLISGFSKPTNQVVYLEYLQKKHLNEILKFYPTQKGDVFFIPAGRVHAIGRGIVVAEIQQTSDITYRIFDYNRTDDQGKERELHTDLALEAIDYTFHEDYKTQYALEVNETNSMVSCPYFTCNLIFAREVMKKDYNHLDSFVIYICAEGSFEVLTESMKILVQTGETILIPAQLKNITILPINEAKIMESYIE